MIFYPNKYIKTIEEITIELLQKNKIKALILDVDNTLVNYNKEMPKRIEKWAKELKGQGTKLYIVSNSNDKEKVKKVSKKLGNIPYTYFAMKPLKKGLKIAQNQLKEKPENIAVVGDQIFTDVIGGNLCKMYTILVDAIEEKDFWYTAWKRPIESKLKAKIKEQK